MNAFSVAHVQIFARPATVLFLMMKALKKNSARFVRGIPASLWDMQKSPEVLHHVNTDGKPSETAINANTIL